MLRRLSVDTAAPDGTRLQAFVSRLSPVNNLIFFDNVTPRPLVAGDDEVRNLVLQGYYISQDSDGFDGLPALRRKSLVAGPDFIDEEIMRGVEDMQVQFGIDNAFDKQPPILYQNNSLNGNIDERTHDPVGRYFWLNAQVKF